MGSIRATVVLASTVITVGSVPFIQCCIIVVRLTQSTTFQCTTKLVLKLVFNNRNRMYISVGNVSLLHNKIMY